MTDSIAIPTGALVPTGGAHGGFLYRVASDTGADNDTFTALLGYLYEWNVKILLKNGHELEGRINGTKSDTKVRLPRYAEVATEDQHGALWGSLTQWDPEVGDFTGEVIPFCWDDVLVLEVQ